MRLPIVSEVTLDDMGKTIRLQTITKYIKATNFRINVDMHFHSLAPGRFD